MGLLLFNHGEHHRALEHLDEAARLMPRSETVLAARGKVYALLGRTQQALDSYRAAYEQAPDSVPVLNQYGEFLRQRGKARESMTLFSRALKLEPRNTETLRCAGNAFHELGLSEQALSCYRMALRNEPGNASIVASMGNVHMAMGDREEAADCFRSALEIDSGLVFAHLGLVSATQGQPCDKQIEVMRRLKGREMPIHERVDLHFALARAYANCRRHDAAIEEFIAGNALRTELTDGPFDIAGFVRETDARIEVLDRDFFAQRASWGVRTDKPVFVVGMPRSGTTLFEAIIGSHPACHMAGELTLLEETRNAIEGGTGGRVDAGALPDLWRTLGADEIRDAARHYLETIDALAPEAARVVDKMPHNFINLWLIALMLPGARVIHCRRDPRDTCVSIFTQVFRKKHGYKNDLRTLGLYYRQYLRLMEHWSRELPVPVLDVRYEDLVADQEGVSRRVIDFCGLEWDPACLEFHRHQRSVMTASALQVRKRIYDTSVGRWKVYERHLWPLLEALGDVVD
jgi:tetratricopeptide (TPR) repeat protein